jgi:hypothetical protein
MALEGPRVLDITIGHLDITQGDSPDPFPATVSGSGWETLDNAATPTFTARRYYDLSGYNKDSLTTFIQGVDIQEGYPPFGNSGYVIVDMITTEYVDDATLLAAYKYTTGDGDLPGFPRSVYDMQQVIYGRVRTFTTNSAWGDSEVQGVSMFGTCAATTADKVHITRVVFVAPGTAETVGSSSHIPPSNYVTAIIVAKEDDLPYLMRQKRSFELATGP